jgi:outer membrane receptor protein involved in Fe transport
VNRFISQTGSGLIRMTNLRLNISTSFSSEGQTATGVSDEKHAKGTDSLELGERFNQRIDYVPEERDFFGENLPGYSPIRLPWTLSASLTYALIRTYKNQDDSQLGVSLNGTLKLTDTWNLTANTMYDFVNKQISNTSLSLTKDLHCWKLLFTWQPTGYSSGFYLKFGINAPQLQDLKIEKRNTPFYR